MVDYLVEMDFYKTASCRCKNPTLALAKLSGSVLYKNKSGNGNCDLSET